MSEDVSCVHVRASGGSIALSAQQQGLLVHFSVISCQFGVTAYTWDKTMWYVLSSILHSCLVDEMSTVGNL